MATTSRFKQQWYFRYDPIDKSRDSFRVVKLLPAPYSAPVECILSDERISALRDRYSALSYTWGDHASQRWILLNGKPFMVQPNLFEALKGIRKEDKEICLWLWVDGVLSIKRTPRSAITRLVWWEISIGRRRTSAPGSVQPGRKVISSSSLWNGTVTGSEEKRQGRLLKRFLSLKRRNSLTLSALYTVDHIGVEPGSSKKSYL